MWLDPIAPKPICFADWAIEFPYARAFSSFSFRCRLLIVKSNSSVSNPNKTELGCSCTPWWAKTRHSLSTLLLMLFTISTTCELWKHTCKLRIWKETWTRDLEFSYSLLIHSATESNYEFSNILFCLFWILAFKNTTRHFLLGRWIGGCFTLSGIYFEPSVGGKTKPPFTWKGSATRQCLLFFFFSWQVADLLQRQGLIVPLCFQLMKHTRLQTSNLGKKRNSFA